MAVSLCSASVLLLLGPRGVEPAARLGLVEMGLILQSVREKEGGYWAGPLPLAALPSTQQGSAASRQDGVDKGICSKAAPACSIWAFPLSVHLGQHLSSCLLPQECEAGSCYCHQRAPKPCCPQPASRPLCCPSPSHILGQGCTSCAGASLLPPRCPSLHCRQTDVVVAGEVISLLLLKLNAFKNVMAKNEEASACFKPSEIEVRGFLAAERECGNKNWLMQVSHLPGFC